MDWILDCDPGARHDYGADALSDRVSHGVPVPGDRDRFYRGRNLLHVQGLPARKIQGTDHRKYCGEDDRAIVDDCIYQFSRRLGNGAALFLSRSWVLTFSEGHRIVKSFVADGGVDRAAGKALSLQYDPSTAVLP